MKFIMQSVSVVHFSPTITLSVTVLLACSFVAHRTEIVCEPSLTPLGVVNFAGDVVATVGVIAPSNEKSISSMPSPDVHVTSTSNPACTAEPGAGDVIINVGSCAPAGPNSAVKRFTSSCVELPVPARQGC